MEDDVQTPRILINRLERDCPDSPLLKKLIYYLREYAGRPLKTISCQIIYTRFLSSMKLVESNPYFLELPEEFCNRIISPQDGDMLTELVENHYSSVVRYLEISQSSS